MYKTYGSYSLSQFSQNIYFFQKYSNFLFYSIIICYSLSSECSWGVVRPKYISWSISALLFNIDFLTGVKIQVELDIRTLYSQVIFWRKNFILVVSQTSNDKCSEKRKCSCPKVEWCIRNSLWSVTLNEKRNWKKLYNCIIKEKRNCFESKFSLPFLKSWIKPFDFRFFFSFFY